MIHSGTSCQKKNNIQQTEVNNPAQQQIPANDTSHKNFTYLALGDSYTIGQDVPLQDNYPNQTIKLLSQDGLYGQLKIIATTGWTTQQLQSAIADDTTLSTYDIVTLLIGVNNQYQGQAVEEYKPGFEDLLKKAIHLAADNAGHVIVLSIPDWSVTPFAHGRDRNTIAGEIDAFNAVNKEISAKYNVKYLDVTPWTREAANDNSLLAGDGLHPSGIEYARWAKSLEGMINRILK